MGSRFPTQTTITVGLPVTPEQVFQSVEGESGRISSTIDSLKIDAGILQESAADLIQTVYGFSTPEIPDITFEVIPLAYADFEFGTAPEMPTGLFRFSDITLNAFGVLPSLVIDGFEQSTFAIPIADTVTFPSDIVLPTFASVPAAPTPIPLTVPPAPGLSLNLGPLPDPGAAPVFTDAGDITDPEFLPIQPFPDCDLQLPDLSAFDTYSQFVGNTFTRTQYVKKVLPQAVQAASALVSGNFVIDIDVLEAGTADNVNRAVDKYARRVSSMWSRRGFDVDEAPGEHIDRVRARVEAEHEADFAAAIERWRIRLLPVALQLSADAHGAMVELLGELYDLDFAFLEAEHAALRSLYSLAAAAFNTQVLQLEMRVAEYRGLVAQVRANADRYRQLAGRAGSIARLNTSLAQGYAAGQRARESQGDVFIAKVRANEAILQAYAAQMQAVEAKAQALRARVVEYDGLVADWEGRFTAARATHQQTRAKNRAIVSRNRASASEIGADVSQSSAIADRAAAEASRAVAIAAFLQGEIASREGGYAQADLNNTLGALKYQAQISDYRTDVALFGADVASDIQHYGSIEAVNRASSGNYADIARGAIRAAEATQQNRIELSNIFSGLYDAAGRADAARISGQLSKFRASYGLQAAGSLSYDSDVGSTTSYDDSVDNSQSNALRKTWTEAAGSGGT